MGTTKKQRLIEAVNFLMSEKIIRTKGDFAEIVGIDSSGNVTQVLSEKYKRELTEEKERKFLSHFPQISAEWYYTGIPPMLKEVAVEDVATADVSLSPEEVGGSPLVNIREADGISLPRIVDEGEPVGRPYYDVDFMGGFGEFLDDPSTKPLYYIDYRPFNKEGVTWVNVYGDSMSPELRPGDTIALKPVRDWADFLLYNRVYAIVTTSGQRAIKYIQKGDDEHHFSLVSVNPDYEPQQIPKRVITAVFEVLGGFKFFG